MMSRLFLTAIIATTFPFAAQASQTFSSGPGQTHLLELYTSEGCSSCPPAEQWFSKLKVDRGLWRDFVPVAFHVDYWDNLGWRDPYASAAFTERQQKLGASWGTDSIYTPEFVLDGSEWQRGEVPAVADRQSGLLSVSANDGTIAVRYASTAADGPWEAHAAVLGMSEKSRVRAGENSGRELEHDFVAKQIASMPLDSQGRATIQIPWGKDAALAVWITKRGELPARQAAGGWLD